MEEEKGSGFLVGLLVGTVVGAAIAVLMTPATGEDARKFLREKAVEPAKSKLAELAGEVRVKAVDIAENVKEKATDMAQDLKDRAEEIWSKNRSSSGEEKVSSYSKSSKKTYLT